VPELFDGTRRVFTEFGRSVIAKAGFILARVEYTKVMGGRPIAITHAGAQVAARTVYQPMNWPLRISALDAIGNQKLGPLIEQDIAGPCCFAGDLLASGRPLPLLEPGEHVIVHDTGGYYFSSPYIYNSLPPIDIYGVTGPDHAICLEELNR
jgi:diaminopimelate decarboxylase